MTNKKTTSDGGGRQRESDSKNGPEMGRNPGDSIGTDQGGGTSNRPPSSSQEPLETTPGGIDTLEASLQVAFAPDTWEALTSRLDRLKEAAAEKREARDPQPWEILETGEGDRLAVQAYGIGKGSGYRWVLEWHGFTLKICNRREFTDTQPNMAVEIGSVPLMLMGHEQAWQAVLGVIAALGGSVEGNVCSRIDPCADLVGVGVGEFFERFFTRCVIRRTRGFAVQGSGDLRDGVQTLYLGKETQVRIYDKLLEATGDEEKWPILVERRWGGVPEKATRVEFQIRREKIQEQFGVRSVEDVFAILPSMVEWFTQEWIRFTEEPVDRENKHQSRATVADCWKQCQEAFEEWAREPAAACVTPIRRARASVKHHMDSAIGNLSAALVKLKGECGGFALECYQLLQEYEVKGTQTVERKRLALAFESLLGPPVDEKEIPF